jgi:hypothetical protein
VRFYPAHLNVLAAQFPPELVRALEAKPGDQDSIRERYCIPTDKFPADLGNIRIADGKIVRNTVVYRFVAMPHYTREKVDAFVEELRRITRLQPNKEDP